MTSGEDRSSPSTVRWLTCKVHLLSSGMSSGVSVRSFVGSLVRFVSAGQQELERPAGARPYAHVSTSTRTSEAGNGVADGYVRGYVELGL